MTLQQVTTLYAQILRQLLPAGGYDTSPQTTAAIDIYAHAQLLAQADLDAQRILNVLSEIPEELIDEYETEYGLPLKCTINSSLSMEERLQLLQWVKQTRNVINQSYLEQLLAFFNLNFVSIMKYRPMQCTSACTAPVNTEQLRYKVLLILAEPLAADIHCIIENYLPAYLRIDLQMLGLSYQTSKPYALEHTEELSSRSVHASDVATLIEREDQSEKLTTSLNIENAQLKILIKEFTVDREGIASGFQISDSTLMSLDFKEPMKVLDALSSNMNIEKLTLKTLVIVNSLQPEPLSTSFSVDDAILGTEPNET